MTDPQHPQQDRPAGVASGGRVRARAWFTPAGQPPPGPDARHPDDRGPDEPAAPTGD